MINLEDIVGRNYEQYLGKYDSPKYPPWMKRKAEGMFQSVAHPIFNRDIGYLFYVNQSSILENREMLVGYFALKYGVYNEIAETWVLLAGTGNGYLLDDSTQISPTLLFSDEEKKAWPSDDPSAEYKNMNVISRMHSSSSRVINLRIGRSSTKEDVKWLIEKLWKTDIEPQLNNKFYEKDIRKKPLYFKKSVAYSLYLEGKSMNEITTTLNERFPLGFDADDPKQELFHDERDVNKMIHDFKPELTEDWFEEVARTFNEADIHVLNKRKLKLKFISEPNPKFILI